jgi:ATP-dependent Clp protease ATP-binding subunit ClpA
MFERFSHEARSVVVLAQEQARQLKHDHIGTEHLLLALLDPAVGPAARVLAEAGVTAASVRAAVQQSVGQPRPALTDEDAEALRSIGIDLERVLARLEETLGSAALTPVGAPARQGRRGFLRRRRRPLGPGGHIPFTGRSKKVLELSLREALALKSRTIEAEHVLLGLLREGQGLAATVLVRQGVDLEQLRAATLRALDRAA